MLAAADDMHDTDPGSLVMTAKRAMIDALRAQGIVDPWVLAAVATAPRDPFVQPFGGDAVGDRTVPSEYLVAVMAQLLAIETGDHVLEIGTASGYSAAVLSMICEHVCTVERVRALAVSARERLARLGYSRISVQCSDGTLGWAEHAPYQGIVVRACGPAVPRSLQAQLAIGGRLVMPIEMDGNDTLVRITRTDRERFELEPFGVMRFSPLIGEEGWPDHDAIEYGTD
jgi:protein-L-isoaspartate(D-aspartate) O-methyltransferase